MKLFKRHIDKKREQVELPEEFDWENMQSDIYEKMSDRQQTIVPNSNKFITLLFVGAAILLTGSILSSVFELGAQNQIVESNLVRSNIENHKDSQSNKKTKSDKNESRRLQTQQGTTTQGVIKEADFDGDKEVNQEEIISNQSVLNLSKSGVGAKNTNLQNEASSKTSFDFEIKNETERSSRQIPNKENIDKIINNKKESYTTSSEARMEEVKEENIRFQKTENKITSTESENSSKDDLGNYRPDYELTKAKAPKVAQVEQTPNASKEILIIEATKKEAVESKVESNTTNKLAMIEVSQLVSQIDILNYENQLVTIPAVAITKVVEPEVGDRFTLGLGFGSNVWDLNFSQLLDGSEKSMTEKTQVGIFGAINLEYMFNDRLFIDAGLQYTQLTSRFNKTAVRSYKEVSADQLIEEVTNVITGSIRQVYGDIELNITETRRVQHFNSFDFLSIPIVVGYKAGAARLNPFVAIGATYNLSLKTSGKTEVDGNILDYTDGESSPYKSSAGLHPLVRFGMACRMKNDIVLSLSGQYQYSVGQWNSAGTFATKPRIIDLGFKIGKSF